MLQAHLKQCRDKQLKLRKEATDSVMSLDQLASKLGELTLDLANQDAEKIYFNERELEKELVAFDSSKKRFLYESRRWERLIKQFTDDFKELGDVENWVAALEKKLDRCIDLVETAHNSKQNELENTKSPS